MAPAVRVGIGEELGLPSNEETTGKMVVYSRKLGFKKVYDTVYSADLTITFSSIIETYKKVLPEGPCGEKAHHLLHTKYAKRGNFR
jgi:iron only hydrogenase large subunit-like protein